MKKLLKQLIFIIVIGIFCTIVPMYLIPKENTFILAIYSLIVLGFGGYYMYKKDW